MNKWSKEIHNAECSNLTEARQGNIYVIMKTFL